MGFEIIALLLFLIIGAFLGVGYQRKPRFSMLRNVGKGVLMEMMDERNAGKE